MADIKDENGSKVTWFVGAAYSGTDDQLPRFMKEAMWESGREDKHLDVVRSMRPGERIAVKSSYTRKRDLPFDNRGQTVSVMAIKAIGTITENMNDGRHVRVDWTKVEPVREWYFYTHRGTVWRVLPGDWKTDGLIGFAFEGKPQDIDRFRNAPDWRERFGTPTTDRQRFGWTKFYETVADKLLAYRNNRTALLEGIRNIASQVDGLGYLAQDQYVDGATGFVRDICPFTTMGLFNRGMTDANRKGIAGKLASFLGVEELLPDTFEGIPLLNNMKSWYFPPETKRDADHIDSLWTVFAGAIAFAEADDDKNRDAFAAAFDDANGRPQVGWKLTFGLYWTRPWFFLTLDHNSYIYITKKLGVQVGRHGPKHRCSAADYLAVMGALEPRFQAQIFGELLTLLEAGKRTPNEALELCYPDEDGKRRPVHIPENLYVVGTMNIADRSLALVDLALRRRFAFVDLEPRLGKTWRDWVVSECAIDAILAADIEQRIQALNEQIAADARLGKQFRIGHSYVTPPYPLEAGETQAWFREVIETDIGPLLAEYWFDAPAEAEKAIERLKQGL
jgi:hypothetical protein